MQANYTPLSPQSFLLRNARVYPDKVAIVDGSCRTTYRQFFDRTCRLANALLKDGLGPQHSQMSQDQLGSGSDPQNVALLAPNTQPHLELNFAIHMAGRALVAINTRLSAREIAYIVKHCEAEVLFVDAEWLPQVVPLLADLPAVRRLVVVEAETVETPPLPPCAVTYEAYLAAGSPEYPALYPQDENQTIALNYTSGTTGLPKGVMYTHRSAYLNAICDVVEMQMTANSVYLWTLPMFHCSGWCYPWAVTSLGATHVCLRKLSPTGIVAAILEHGVTHLCGAPIVLQMIADGARELNVEGFSRRLRISTAAAPPSPTIIQRMIELNADVVHVYGLTETYGPTTVCELQPTWGEVPLKQQARLMARQGVPYLLAQDVQVLNEADQPVPADGQTMGEVCMRGNVVMKGYYKDPEATHATLRNGWFHSGDLGVLHPDGYIELRDRAKDIIISGGENISTIEVENALSAHPQVRDVAVVSRPDEKWGEVPVAIVSLEAEDGTSEGELIEFCRARLAHYKAPKAVFFDELPRTSTGKVQKYRLRARFWEGRERQIN